MNAPDTLIHDHRRYYLLEEPLENNYTLTRLAYEFLAVSYKRNAEQVRKSLGIVQRATEDRIAKIYTQDLKPCINDWILTFCEETDSLGGAVSKSNLLVANLTTQSRVSFTDIDCELRLSGSKLYAWSQCPNTQIYVGFHETDILRRALAS